MRRWLLTYAGAFAAVFVIDGIINLVSNGTWFNPEGRNLQSLIAAPIGITALLWAMNRYPTGWRKWVFGVGLFVLSEIIVTILLILLSPVVGVDLLRI